MAEIYIQEKLAGRSYNVVSAQSSSSLYPGGVSITTGGIELLVYAPAGSIIIATDGLSTIETVSIDTSVTPNKYTLYLPRLGIWRLISNCSGIYTEFDYKISAFPSGTLSVSLYYYTVKIYSNSTSKLNSIQCSMQAGQDTFYGTKMEQKSAEYAIFSVPFSGSWTISYTGGSKVLDVFDRITTYSINIDS